MQINAFDPLQHPCFNFTETFLTHYKSFGSIIYISNQLFIAPTFLLKSEHITALSIDTYYQIATDSLICWHAPTLHRQGLVIGKCNIPTNFNNRQECAKIIQFKQHQLHTKLLLLQDQLKNIHCHLSERTIGGSKITCHPTIRSRFAQIASHLTLAKQILKQPDPLAFKPASKHIFEATKLSMRLPGGRAYLEGGLLDLFITFHLLRTVYFQGESYV
jgi:hypothetical protein